MAELHCTSIDLSRLARLKSNVAGAFMGGSATVRILRNNVLCRRICLLIRLMGLRVVLVLMFNRHVLLLVRRLRLLNC